MFVQVLYDGCRTFCITLFHNLKRSIVLNNLYELWDFLGQKLQVFVTTIFFYGKVDTRLTTISPGVKRRR